MAGGGNKNPISTATGTSSGYTWNGAKPPSTFDSKAFTTGILGDLANWQKSPLQTNPYGDFVDYSQGSKDLINQGISQAGNVANNSVLQGMASGSMLGQGNPYLNGALASTRENILKDVGAQFTNSGRFGGGSYVNTAVDTLANAENNARFGQYNNDVSQMLGAQTALNNATATGLGYSNLFDQKAQELNKSNQASWDRQYMAPYNRITQTLGALHGQAQNANQPTNLWDILGTGLNVAGSILPFL